MIVIIEAIAAEKNAIPQIMDIYLLPNWALCFSIMDDTELRFIVPALGKYALKNIAIQMRKSTAGMANTADCLGLNEISFGITNAINAK